MRGTCKKCSRETILTREGICQKCAHRGKVKLIKVDILKSCIHCGAKRTHEVYHPNWKCDSCGKMQFEHEQFKEFRGKDEQWEYSAEKDLEFLVFRKEVV